MNIERTRMLAEEDGHKTECCGLDAAIGQLKALGHPVRMQIVSQLIASDRRCCGEICSSLPLAQSTISQHLDMLCKAGLVEYVPEGNRSRYSLNRTAFKALARAISDMAERDDAERAGPMPAAEPDGPAVTGLAAGPEI